MFFLLSPLSAHHIVNMWVGAGCGLAWWPGGGERGCDRMGARGVVSGAAGVRRVWGRCGDERGEV